MEQGAALEMRPDGWALLRVPKMLLVATHEEIERMRRRGKIWKRNDNTRPTENEPGATPELYR
jgi:tRNA G37 N-methylase TrmD